jgi:hypothetical protein
MGKRKSKLLIVTFIIALAGLGIGVYSLINASFYVLPVARVYHEGSTFLIPDGGASTLFDYNQKLFDSHQAFDLTSDSYTIPEEGYYQVTAQYSISAIDGSFFSIRLYVNNILVCARSSTSSQNTNVFGVVLTDFLIFNRGDSLTIRVYQSDPGVASRAIYGGEEYTFFAIAKVA